MGWLSSAIDGAKAVGNYALTTLSYGAKQVGALGNALPAITKQNVWNVFEGIGNIVFYDVLPVVAVNYGNNQMQNYFHQGYDDEEEQSMFAPYALFLSTLTLVGYGVQVYNYRQATKLVARTFAIDAMGPSSFNEYKSALTVPPPTLCEEEGCNFKRKIKGSVRRVGTLALDELVLLAVSKIPYGGEQAAWALGIYFYGSYIEYMGTPERCDRHKFQTSEAIVSLGITHALASYYLDKLLESTVGIPPFLYHRTLNHILLLLEINIASHMTFPLVKPPKDAIPVNPFIIYDNAKNFLVDSAISGLLTNIPLYFRPKAKPLVPLATVLKFLTRMVDSDLEQEKIAQPGFFKKAMTTTKKVLLPSMFHSSKNTVNDTVIKKFWPDIRSDLLYILDIVKATEPVKELTTAVKPIASTAKYTIPQILHMRYGLSIKLGEFLVSLSKKEEFWEFVKAFTLWLGRNNVSFEIQLSKDSVSKEALHGSEKIIELPDEPKEIKPLPPAKELQTPKTPTLVDAKQLVTQRTSTTTGVIVSANSLFTTRRRKEQNPAKDSVQETVLLDQSLSCT